MGLGRTRYYDSLLLYLLVYLGNTLNHMIIRPPFCLLSGIVVFLRSYLSDGHNGLPNDKLY